MFRPLSLALLALGSSVAQSAPPAILVYHRTLEYYHESIPTAISALTALSSNLYTPTFSEDPLLFRPTSLSQFAAIVFLSNSEVRPNGTPILDEEGQQALNEWLGKGGALVGLHSGCGVLYNTPSFGVAMGSWFDYHPDISNVTFLKTEPHPTTDILPARYSTFEETYNFLTPPSAVNVTVLLTPDASSYSDPLYATQGHYQGSPHPSAWYRDEAVDLSNGTEPGAPRMTGRLWYTSLGHTSDTWREAQFLGHVKAGLQWALEGPNNTLLNSTSSSNTTSSTSTAPSSSAVRSSASSAGAATPSSSSTPSSGALQLVPGSLLSLFSLVGLLL